ncbi:DISARM system phospholipase D-like protein DrmC [Streptomyces sp. SID1143]|uniref:DISARM system phospholipase D-like protein DrmC n=1 Tax=Streptomyces sp. SID1143 TaxID=3425889 RepID=UPI0040567E48
MTTSLAELLGGLAQRLPAERLTEWQEVLRSSKGPDDPRLDHFGSRLAAAGLAQLLADLRREWRGSLPQLPGPALALALEAASPAARSRPDPPVELVVTGPTSPSVPVRLTRGVLTEVIRSADRSLLVASYAVYGVTEVKKELRRAVHRGVHIDLLLERSTDAAEALAEVTGSVPGQTHIWHRHDTRSQGVQHAKLVLADRHTALLGSANLTDRALSDNLEIGVILRDPKLVGRLADHFQWLTRPPHGPFRHA